MTARVGVEFDGRANGVVTAGKRAEGAIRGVRHEAAGASPSLRNLESDLGRS
jgi:hypothetical protein